MSALKALALRPITVVVPLETRKKLGLNADYTFEVNERRLVPAGINVIDGKRINETLLEEEIIVIPLRRNCSKRQ